MDLFFLAQCLAVLVASFLAVLASFVVAPYVWNAFVATITLSFLRRNRTGRPL